MTTTLINRWCPMGGRHMVPTPDGDIRPRECSLEIFKDDGECTCGVWKHHWHCEQCGKVTQVG